MSSLIGVLDDSLLLWLNSFADRWPLLDHAVRRLLKADELKFGLLVMVFYWLWFLAGAGRPARRAVLVMTAIGGIVGLFGARLLALLLPFRERPLVRIDLGFVAPGDYETALRTWSAFPSDHAIVAFALSTGFWLVSRPVGALAFLHSIVFICLPRLYFGLHHPTDIVGGALIGILVAMLMNRESLRRPVSTAVFALETRFPGPFYAAFFLVLFEMATLFNGVRGIVESVFKHLHGAS